MNHISAFLLSGSKITPPKEITLPYSETADADYMTASYLVVFNHMPYQSPRFQIQGDDCIQSIILNEIPVALDEFPPNQLCDYAHYLNVDFSDALRSGSNSLIITVENRGGNYGMDVKLPPSLFQITFWTLCIVLLAAPCVALVTPCIKRLRLSTPTKCLLLLAVPYFLFWLHYYPNFSYTNDVFGHISYIDYMTNNWMQPYDYMGHENWHPPLYYFLASRVLLYAGMLYADPLTGVRLFSLFLYMIFCVYGVRTLRDAVERENLTYYVGICLIIFWPTSIIMATRITNDIALYAAWSATLYYLLHWCKERNPASLALAITLQGVVFMIKSNAVIPFAIVVACIGYALVTKHVAWKSLLHKKILLACGVLCLGILVNTGKIILHNFSTNNQVLSLHFGGGGGPGPDLDHYMHFDLTQYISRPFNLVWQEPFFLNNFLKTMLYGEFTWKYMSFASGLNILLLVFLIITLLSFFTMTKKHLMACLPYLIATLFPWLAVMAFYAIKHSPVCQDFRFVVPMIIPLVVLFVHGMEAAHRLRTTRPLYWLGIAAGTSLPMGAIVFYLAQYWW